MDGNAGSYVQFKGSYSSATPNTIRRHGKLLERTPRNAEDATRGEIAESYRLGLGKKLRFQVQGNPIAQPRTRATTRRRTDGRVVASVYSPANAPIQRWKVEVATAYALAGRELEPLAGVVHLDLHFLFARPQRLCRKNAPDCRIPHVGKPDLDNLAKGVLDALNGLAWADDRQVSLLMLRKSYVARDEEPGMLVEISEH